MISIIHDGELDIAVGRSRKETHWRNKSMQWSDLLSRVSQTHYTAETRAEYVSSKKTRQDEIKDIGGFVGGYINGGRRKAGNILHRQLVTLDIDFAKGDIWGDYCLLYGNAGAVYSTHKHAPDNPRLRLIIPLDRPVACDEYVAIARRIAGNLGIDNFDDTTYQPERLMYWPSTSKDGEYVFDYLDGEWLCADEVLGSYRNWRDTSEWPVSERAGEVIQREIKKQGDPLDKPGIIGAFCRTYDIHEAIEAYLSDVYVPCDGVDNRYTYKEGSTSAGLVVYDDKYSYSHHSTDPSSLKLCNSFDLVRLHLYGLRDEDVKEGTPSNRLPSYVAMVELASKDGKVRKRLGEERLQEAKSDFAEIYAEEDTDWLGELDVDGKGNNKATADNIRLILEHDPSLRGVFAKNKFENREVALRDLPWRKVTPRTQYLSDVDDAGVRAYLETTYGITGVQKIKDGLDLIINKNAYHPVIDYLGSLRWDGVRRLDTLLIDYLGAEDSEYTRAVTRKTLVAAVARVMVPGCKFDYVLTIVGKQGIGKSTIIKKLGKSWYSDSFGTVQGKEAFEQIQGVWLLEMGELAGLKKAEMETIKHFISKQEDRYRVAYGRRTENFPRQCVFFGTTNDKDFLRDPTGNRRFWPIDTLEQEPTKSVFDDLTEEVVDQLWAEAVTLYRAGEPLHLSKELEEQATLKQREHSETDERAGIIQRYLDIPLPESWEDMSLSERRMYVRGDELAERGTVQRDRVCVAEIWCELFGRDQADMTRYNTQEINKILRTIEGWDTAKNGRGTIRHKLYGTQKYYTRKL